jgi:hypothetical protein
VTDRYRTSCRHHRAEKTSTSTKYGLQLVTRCPDCGAAAMTYASAQRATFALPSEWPVLSVDASLDTVVSPEHLERDALDD